MTYTEMAVVEQLWIMANENPRLEMTIHDMNERLLVLEGVQK